MGVFFVYPVVTILGRGLWPDGGLDFSPVGHVFSDSGMRHIMWFTVWQAAASTALTLVVALPAAFVVARYRFRGRALVRGLMIVPFVLPTVVVASAFRALGFEPSIAAILLAHAFFNYAVVVYVVGGLWSHLDPRQEDAARVLGATRLRALVSVTLPALRPAILAATSIVFLFSFTSFGIILILGGPSRATLETEIYRQTTQVLDLRTAAALSIVQLIAVVALLVMTGSLGRRTVPLSLVSAPESVRLPRAAGERALLTGVLTTTGLLLGTPIAVLVARSFDTADGFGFGFYRALGELHANSVLFVPPAEAIGNSVLYALGATAIALLVGGTAAFAIARSRRGAALNLVLALPLGVSAVTVGFGFLIALDEQPLDLRGSWVLVPIAHALVAVAVVVYVAVPVLRSIEPRLREAAAVLGASPRAVWREVDLPIAARGLLVAAGFAFAISLGEFGATAFIARPDRPTLPVVVFRLLGQPGAQNFGAAMAASTILMLLTLVSVLAIERFRTRELGAF
ncbi:MAG: iron ABC transporter permease [Acidimicrobiia bacterium]